jgi:hypothetical protein
VRKAITMGVVAVMVLVGFVAMANPLAANMDVPTISKTMEQKTDYHWAPGAWLGETWTVTIQVHVPVGMTGKVCDELPEPFSYLPGTLTVDGIGATPMTKDHTVCIKVDDGDHTIIFDMIVDSAPEYSDSFLNTATLSVRGFDDEDACADVWVHKFCNLNKGYTNFRDENGNGIIDLQENIIMDLEITLHNPYPWPMVDAFVWDRFGAEWEIDDYNAPETPNVVDEKYIDYGDWWFKTKGKSDKVFLYWDLSLVPGDFPAYQDAKLVLQISTDLNPSGKQEYTSPGCYLLNSGLVLKFKNPDGIQLSAHEPSIYINVPEP